MLMPKNKEFFELIDKVAQNVFECAQLLEAFIAQPVSEATLKPLKDKEHVGDKLTHEVIELMNKSFITPLDREDIHELVSSLDDILDYIYGGADRMVLYKITAVSDEFKALANILVRVAEEVSKATLRLRDMKNPQVILAQCININQLENAADKAHRQAIASLFEKEKDPIQVMKVKEILDQMENATDACEDVANVIESIVLKNA